MPTDAPEANVPNDGSIVAIAVLVLTHVPPVGVPVRVAPLDTHMVSAPLIVGVWLTVTTIVAAVPQPFE